MSFFGRFSTYLVKIFISIAWNDNNEPIDYLKLSSKNPIYVKECWSKVKVTGVKILSFGVHYRLFLTKSRILLEFCLIPYLLYTKFWAISRLANGHLLIRGIRRSAPNPLICLFFHRWNKVNSTPSR